MGNMSTKQPAARVETSSVCTTEADTGTHNFVVMNYSLLDGVGIGEFISSSTFSVGGHEWCIKFYPDGNGRHPSYADAFLAPCRAVAEEGMRLMGRGPNYPTWSLGVCGTPHAPTSKKCPAGIKESIKIVLEVQNETLSEKYLGMLSGVGKSKNGAFKYLKDKVWKKVLGWLEMLLSVLRAIIEGRDTLKLGLIRRIGDGTTTAAWRDNWLPQDERLTPVAPIKADAPEMVSAYIDPTSATWNMERLEEFFLPMDVEGYGVSEENQMRLSGEQTSGFEHNR
ncbi:hypothetical protein QYE76_046390 [Lolium multiflorum]|uniref:MATH domain-containing protein n=1 Tax=Lolium multiflorum TaxID=4521 RepID=A0AAD8TPP0_LOLMU|nr:hypothetical protein QYE76_046390 [Lolium multiflorum]